jgi:antitoxin component of RelBE/YafQ-DinJ toxin-antitoxin module
MAEMNAWEKRCVARDEECIAGARAFDEAAKLAMSEYMEIFRKYCSRTKAVPRDLFYDNPPDYDPDGEAILAISQLAPDLVQIRTQQNYAFGERNVYRLVSEDGKWRLLDKKIESAAEKGVFLDASL